MLRFHRLLAGASWRAEYGDPDIPEERAWIQQYSPYQNLRAGQPYPEVFIHTSTKDDRVHPGHARKAAARLEELGYPVLFYENTDGGHAAGANLRETARRLALEYTYLTRRLMDVGSERYEFMNCSHQNGDFSVTAVCDRRAVHVDPCLVIFGIFSLVRTAAAVRSLDAQTILSVMQQHIISTVYLHQHQLQAAWALVRETDAAQTAKSSGAIGPA
jgi:hypothetical protein